MSFDGFFLNIRYIKADRQWLLASQANIIDCASSS